MHRRFYPQMLKEPTDYYLKYDLQSDFLDTSGNGNNGLGGGTLPDLTTKDGKLCAYFNGSKSIKTTNNLSLYREFTVFFEIFTETQTTTQIIAELSTNFNSNPAFAIYRATDATILSSVNNGSATYNVKELRNFKGSWKKIAFIYNSQLTKYLEWETYTNGVNSTISTATENDLSNVTMNNKLFIGQRAGSSVGFTGYLRNFQVFSRAITKNEAIALTK